jgi:hypothetical protein
MLARAAKDLGSLARPYQLAIVHIPSMAEKHQKHNTIRLAAAVLVEED